MMYPMCHSTFGVEEEAVFRHYATANRHTMGPITAEFEQAFAKKMGSKYALFVNSGSSANLLAVAGLFYRNFDPLWAGDEVIVPAISWATTYYPLQQYGLKLKFVDVDINTLNMDFEQLKEAITDRTRMIVAVNILGNPCELNHIRKLCDVHELILFEDNCESMGATLSNKQCGTFGDIGTYSTFFSHHISTVEGGLIVTDDKDLYNRCKSMRSHGWTRDVEGIYEEETEDFYEKYRFILPGYNLRNQELNAALGLCQLDKLDGFIAQRRRNAELFKKLFQDDQRFIIQKEVGRSSWFAFTLICNEVNRMDVMRELARAGIEHRIITGGCFTEHDVIEYFDYEIHGNLHNAVYAHTQGFFVGNSHKDLTDQLLHLREVLSKL
jgi:CDP-6-deoxy-D-xylo-4-hexulose-3-dehydrase